MTGHVESEIYRRFSDDIAAAVGLLSTKVGRWDYLTPIDSFLDVSYDPPTMLLSLYAESRAAEALEDTGACAVSVLADTQEHLVTRYGEPGLPLQGMLAGVEHDRDAAGHALVAGALVHFSLQVEAMYPAATHQLVVCRVLEVRADAGRAPAVRFAKRMLRHAPR